MISRHQIAIIGAGPAGAACAIQLKREGFEPVLFEKYRAGGTLKMAGWIENMPFISAGTPGAELADIIESNLAYFNIEIVTDEIIQIEKADSSFCLQSASGQKYQADFVVIACGLAHSRLNLPEPLAAFLHEGPETPADDGDVLIIGGGDVALDRAISWKSQNNKRSVCVLNRSNKWKALPALQKKACHIGIELHQGDLEDLSAHENGFRFKNESGLFRHLVVHIGREERLPQIYMNSKSIVPRAATDCGETQISGLFLAGDARRVGIRHASIAASDGMLAALEIASRLKAGSTADDKC